MILLGLSLGLSSPRFGGTPDAAVVAKPALTPHVSAFCEAPHLPGEWVDHLFVLPVVFVVGATLAPCGLWPPLPSRS